MAKVRNGMSESDAGKLGALKTNLLYKEHKEKEKKQYLLNPKYCLYCGNIIPFEKRNNKCCCRSCSTSYSNKFHSKESRLKQKQTLCNTLQKQNSKKSQKQNYTKNKIVKIKKIKYCKWCGAEKGKCKDTYVCHKYQLYNTLEKFGFDKSKIGTEEIINEFYRIRDIIEHEYKINRITNQELKEKYNYIGGSANFHKILHSLNIKTYNNSEANALSISLGRLNPGGNSYFKEYVHTSWENNIYHLRSSYEEIYANELDRNKIKYDYEKLIINYFDTQQNRYRNAIPDFYLVDDNMIVEIKSSYTLNLQNMKDKKKSYLENGYKFKCICDFKEIEV